MSTKEDVMTRQKPILVLGSTGKTGRRVVERLTASGIPTRAGTRSAEPRFDWDDRDTWAPVLQGVGAVYLQHYLDALPGSAEILGSFADLAVANGIPRIVHLSGRGETHAEDAAQAVRDTGAEVTTLRSTWFSQNFSESYFLDGLLAGELALPAGYTPEPFVDADDIADIAVAALTDERHVGEVYELTGPRLLTFSDAVAEIGQAAGRQIRYAPVSVEDFATGLEEQGVPGDWIVLLVYLFQEVLDGRNAHLADGVQRALGREPTDFADYARDAAATGVWTPALARLS
jgi:uncharacterized protein YbjT (DUF2867 family)